MLSRLTTWRNALELPTLTRELRGRMRGKRTFVIMFIYVGGLSAVAAVLFAEMWLRTSFLARGGGHGYSIMALQEQGRQLFEGLVVLQVILIALFAPALTCGSLSGEWERQSFELLALTTLSTANILLGKLLAPLCFVGLLLICGLPLFALGFMFGGVSPVEVLLVDLASAGIALVLGAIGLLASTMVKRTCYATALSYAGAAVLAIVFATAASAAESLLILCGVVFAVLVTGFLRWWIPRRKPAWKPDRAVYFAIFGFCLCLATLVFYTHLDDVLKGWLQANVQQALSVSIVAIGIFLSIVAFVSAGAAFAGAVSVFRAMRAPQPDSLEVIFRVERELREARRVAG